MIADIDILNDYGYFNLFKTKLYIVIYKL